MAYDPSLNVTLVEKEVYADDKTAISLTADQYNGGEIKIQISRTYIKRDGSRSFRKLGRLTMVEAGAVAQAMPEFLITVAEG
jgi:hypothetical protein